MPSFLPIERDTIGRISKWDIPVNEWLGIKFGLGADSTIFNAVENLTEDFIYSQGAMLNPDIANQQFGIPGYLSFDKPVDIQRARLMNERKRAELERLAYIESASHSGFGPKAIAGFGAMMVGGLANPLDFATALFPVVGSEKVAAGIAKQSIASGFRQRLARGIITEEALVAKGIKFPQLTIPMIDASINQAIVEIPIALQKYRDQAEYTVLDSVFNVGVGGLFAGGLKAFGIALGRAHAAWKNADSRIKAATINAKMQEMAFNTPKVSDLMMALDENAIRERVMARRPFNEEQVRAEAMRIKEPTGAPIYPTLEAHNKALEEAGLPRESESEWRKYNEEQIQKYVEAPAIPLVRKVLKEGNKPVSSNVFGPGDKGVWFVNKHGETLFYPFDSQSLKSELEVLAQKESSGQPLTDAETAKLNELEPEEYNAYQKRVGTLERQLEESEDYRAERDRSIQEFIDKAKAEYEASLKGEIDAELKAEIERIQQRGKTLTDEQIRDYSSKPHDDASIAVLEDDIATLEQNILHDTLPEQREAVEAELKAIDEQAKEVSGEKAVDEAIPCVTAKANA